MESKQVEEMQDIVYVISAPWGDAEAEHCFAACQSGIHRSLDGGRSWSLLEVAPDQEGSPPITAVVSSPDYGRERTIFAGGHGAVMRSIDGGDHWRIIALPAPPPPLVTTLAISPNYDRDGVLFAGTLEDGVFRSGDRGERWGAWNFGLLDLGALALAISPHFAANETLFAGVESGVFRSANGGRAWRETDFPMEYAPVPSLAVTVGADGDDILFAGTEAHGLWLSRSQGKTWRRVGEEAVTGGVNAILLDPDRSDAGDMLILHEGELLITRDGGEHWAQLRLDLPDDAYVAAVAAPRGLAPNAPLILGLVGGGLLRREIHTSAP
jgi:photosystem II stability/assembly factor-like uncharacterized protein